MVTGIEDKLKEIEKANEEIIRSVYWACPVYVLDTWRPFTATLNYELFFGPEIRAGHGLDLKKNIVGYWDGPRGSTKSLSLSYSLSKILRSGKPVWTNYPISFYVLETDKYTGHESTHFNQELPCQWVNDDGTLRYYETLVLDMEAFYRFAPEIRNGAVGITELQYFVEARTSGKYQNRVLGYQLMQIRKTANSFFYDVQNPKWVDGRFGWSADFECKCADVSKKLYDMRTLGRELEEGEVSRWIYHDISGLMTGDMYDETKRDIGPYQFNGRPFWNIYPTHFIVDVFEAMKGPERGNEKKQRDALLSKAIEESLNQFFGEDNYLIDTRELMEAVQKRIDFDINMVVFGRYISSMGVEKKLIGRNKFAFDFRELQLKESKN